LFCGANLIAIGLVGDYVARIYEEVKGRPLYVVSESCNLEQRASAPVRGVFLPQLARSVPTSLDPATNGVAKNAHGNPVESHLTVVGS
jgi:polyisoprenyl-phosphate glycosyltransferase